MSETDSSMDWCYVADAIEIIDPEAGFDGAALEASDLWHSSPEVRRAAREYAIGEMGIDSLVAVVSKERLK